MAERRKGKGGSSGAKKIEDDWVGVLREVVEGEEVAACEEQEEDGEDEEEDDDEEEEDESADNKKNKYTIPTSFKTTTSTSTSSTSSTVAAEPAKKRSTKGYNWTAIFILFLFSLVPIILGTIAVYDWAYPEQAERRQIRDMLLKCYSNADPTKLDKVDNILKKCEVRDKISRSKLRSLWAKLREKYERVPECQRSP